MIKYRTLEDGTNDLTKHFVPDHFPQEVLSKAQILDEECWKNLLRPEEGEKKVHEFIPMDSFCFIVVVEDPGGPLPEDIHRFFSVIRVGAGGKGGGGGGSEGSAEGGYDNSASAASTVVLDC